MSNVGIITGGASGIGLEVARALSAKGWKLYLFDRNETAGVAAQGEVYNTEFIKVDVRSWESQAAAFQAVFQEAGRLDFVFANAGVFENIDYYEAADQLPPPPPAEQCLDINLQGTIKTSHLAQHYFRASPHKGNGAVLVMTSSISGLYATPNTPLYAASKAGLLNYMRSIAAVLYPKHGIRVYAICPAGVRTPLLSDAFWEHIDTSNLTPMLQVVSTIEMLMAGGQMRDSKGRVVEADQANGLTVEINMDKLYFRDQVDFSDERLEAAMGGVTADQAGKRDRQ